MASLGPAYPGSCVVDASWGTDGWENPVNVTGNTDNVSTVSIINLGDWNLQGLKATNFGFLFSPDVIIQGITVEWERGYDDVGESGSFVRDRIVRIVKGDVVGATEHSSGATWTEGANTFQSFGGTSDLWGETWTPADINSNGFGALCAPSVENHGAAVAAVRRVRITVHYTISAPLPGLTPVMRVTRESLVSRTSITPQPTPPRGKIKPYSKQAGRVTRVGWTGRMNELAREITLAVANPDARDFTHDADASRLLRTDWSNHIDGFAQELRETLRAVTFTRGDEVQRPFLATANRVTRTTWVDREDEFAREVQEILASVII